MEKEQADTEAGSIEKRLQQSKHSEALGLVAIEKEPSGRSPQAQLERIGHMLMSDESRPKPLTDQRIETMNRTQLLEHSEKIRVDGSSLRQIYETHLIGERGLRHLVAEYMRDGDLKQALRQEIIERERDFERDPAMRHRLEEATDIDSSSLSKSTLEELLAKTGMATDERAEETAFFKARARYEAEELHQHKQRRRVIDISLALIILILLIMVIVLLLR